MKSAIPPLSIAQTTDQITPAATTKFAFGWPSNETGGDQQSLPVESATWNGNGGIPWFIPSLSFTGQKLGYFFKFGDFGLGYYFDPVQIINYSNKLLTETNGSHVPPQMNNMMSSDTKTVSSGLTDDAEPSQPHKLENSCTSNESKKDENISESKDLHVTNMITSLPPKPKGPPPPWAFRK